MRVSWDIIPYQRADTECMSLHPRATLDAMRHPRRRKLQACLYFRTIIKLVCVYTKMGRGRGGEKAGERESWLYTYHCNRDCFAIAWLFFNRDGFAIAWLQNNQGLTCDHDKLRQWKSAKNKVGRKSISSRFNTFKGYFPDISAHIKNLIFSDGCRT